VQVKTNAILVHYPYLLEGYDEASSPTQPAPPLHDQVGDPMGRGISQYMVEMTLSDSLSDFESF
jgi:hypothetical protein